MDNFVGLFVAGGVVAGLGPDLLAALEVLLGCGAVDLLRMHRGLGQDSDALGQHLHEAPGDEELLVAGGASVQPDLARAELRQQRRRAVERLHVAGGGGQLDRVGGGVEEHAVGSDQPDGEGSGLGGVSHYAFAVSFIFSAAALTSSMPPFR